MSDQELIVTSTPWGVRLPDPSTEAGATSPALLMPLFRSEAQARLLAELFLDPGDAPEVSVADLAARTGVASTTAHREIRELVEAGLLTDRHRDGERLVCPAFISCRSALAEVIAYGYGAKPLLERELSQVPGITRAFLFGSWAARYSGVRGMPPHDVDLLVMGNADFDALCDACEAVRRRIRREIHLIRYSAEKWEAGMEPFVQTVRERPIVELTLGQATASEPSPP
jgi:DNA-binding Lrp family transcriptional regulator